MPVLYKLKVKLNKGRRILFIEIQSIDFARPFREGGGKMTKRDIFSISLKFLAVLCLLYAAMAIPRFISLGGMLFQPIRQGFMPYVFLAAEILETILSLVFAYILLRWGDFIAGKLVPADSEILSLDAEELKRRPVFILALKIIGVVCLIQGIPQLAQVLAVLSFGGNKQVIIQGGAIYPPALGNQSGEIASALVLLIIGGYLISGGRYLVEFAFRKNKIPSDSDSADCD